MQKSLADEAEDHDRSLDPRLHVHLQATMGNESIERLKVEHNEICTSLIVNFEGQINASIKEMAKYINQHQRTQIL